MKVVQVLSFVLFMLTSIANSAQTFDMTISADSILAGNILHITYKANNVSGQFEGPKLEGLQIVSGPNTANLVTMTNGKMIKKSEYSYSVLLKEEGEYVIEPAFLRTASEDYETAAMNIVVLPNPEGIIEKSPLGSQESKFGFPTNSNKASKKSKNKKLKKI